MSVDRETKKSISNVRRLVSGVKRDVWKNEIGIELMAASAVAGEPLLMLGDPGAGKTRMATLFFEALGLPRGRKEGYFEICLHPFIEPSQVFGPLDFNKLTASAEGTTSQYSRLTDGYLPSARGAFLDEIFAASPDFLLTMLSIVDDRKYYNGAEVLISPLSILFAASNELPDSRKLGALGDRIPIRFVAEQPQNADERAQVLAKSHVAWVRRQLARLGAAPKSAPPNCTYEDIRQCGLALLDVKNEDDFPTVPFIGQYTACLDKLSKHPNSIANTSARTQQKVYQVMRALALLRRENPEPGLDEMRVLEHTFTRVDPSIRADLHSELKEFPQWVQLPEGDAGA